MNICVRAQYNPICFRSLAVHPVRAIRNWGIPYTYHQMLAHSYGIIIQLRLLLGKHSDFLHNNRKYPWLPSFGGILRCPESYGMDDHGIHRILPFKQPWYFWNLPIFRINTNLFFTKPLPLKVTCFEKPKLGHLVALILPVFFTFGVRILEDVEDWWRMEESHRIQVVHEKTPSQPCDLFVCLTSILRKAGKRSSKSW